jgi:hypothetical protein
MLATPPPLLLYERSVLFFVSYRAVLPSVVREARAKRLAARVPADIKAAAVPRFAIIVALFVEHTTTQQTCLDVVKVERRRERQSPDRPVLDSSSQWAGSIVT